MKKMAGSFTVDVWSIPLTDARPEFLSPDERERAARLRFEQPRLRWVRARSALRSVLAEYVGQSPESLAFRYGEHGKPSLSGIEFNLSHAGDFALIAVSANAPVGIDIEVIRPDVDIGKLLERIGETDLPDDRAQLFRRWARREAATKATGGPLMIAPDADVRVADVNAPEGYCAAVAQIGVTPVVRYR